MSNKAVIELLLNHRPVIDEASTKVGRLQRSTCIVDVFLGDTCDRDLRVTDEDRPRPGLAILSQLGGEWEAGDCRPEQLAREKDLQKSIFVDRESDLGKLLQSCVCDGVLVLAGGVLETHHFWRCHSLEEDEQGSQTSR